LDPPLIHPTARKAYSPNFAPRGFYEFRHEPVSQNQLIWQIRVLPVRGVLYWSRN
jgi:hypothetical protein